MGGETWHGNEFSEDSEMSLALESTACRRERKAVSVLVEIGGSSTGTSSSWSSSSRRICGAGPSRRWASSRAVAEEWRKSSAENRRCFFLGLVAAWVSPGRSALQSAKQRCYVRNGHNHKMMSYIIKTLSKTCNKAKKPSAYPREAEAKKQDRVYKTRALVKSRRKAPTPEQEVRIFFFLHCRASAKHSRSTTGNMK